ncbi:MAG TPA: Flp family type IVb pilin [Anaeromyxobacteraceae bacterium]|nr:Flp family type IVb pilin [Anaeromyxobacteraceae bacterium]
MRNLFKKLWADESGASLIEYVLLAALIGVAALVGMGLVGTAANTRLTNVAGSMGGQAAP